MSEFDFRRFIGEPMEVEIENQKLRLLPLDTEDLPNFFKAMRAFSGGEELPENATKEQKQAAQEKMLKNMDDAGLNAVKTIIEKTLIKSYPNEKVDQLKVFGLKYMGLLMGKIFELNTAQYGK